MGSVTSVYGFLWPAAQSVKFVPMPGLFSCSEKKESNKVRKGTKHLEARRKTSMMQETKLFLEKVRIEIESFLFLNFSL